MNTIKFVMSFVFVEVGLIMLCEFLGISHYWAPVGMAVVLAIYVFASVYMDDAKSELENELKPKHVAKVYYFADYRS